MNAFLPAACALLLPLASAFAEDEAPVEEDSAPAVEKPIAAEGQALGGAGLGSSAPQGRGPSYGGGFQKLGGGGAFGTSAASSGSSGGSAGTRVSGGTPAPSARAQRAVPVPKPGAPVAAQAASDALAASASGGKKILSRDYIGTEKLPCPYGPRIGRCQYQGKDMIDHFPPPTPDGFRVMDLYAVESFPGTQERRVLYLGGGKKYALRFKGRDVGPFAFHFGSWTQSVLYVPKEMWIAVSRTPGSYDVPPGCLVTPASQPMSMGAGGATHGGAILDIRWARGAAAASNAHEAERGQLCLLEPTGDYYLNVAGYCSEYWDPEKRYPGWQRDCPADLNASNGGIPATKP